MKIALCIPCYGDTKAKFTMSLVNMLTHFMSVRFTDDKGEEIKPDIATFFVSCSMLTESRHRLVAEALTWGADYMLFMDADHIFPQDALARLWSRNKMVVGCNYARRADPTGPTAAKDHELCYTTPEKVEADLVEEVDHLGFGLCLIDMRVFAILQEQAGDESILPLFEFKAKPDGIGVIGEDVFFFAKLKAAGIKIHCDHALSWEVGHIHEHILTNAHAVVQKDKWNELMAQRGKKFALKAEELEQAA